MALGLMRLLSRLTHPDEVVGILTPNAAPTLGLVIALSAGKHAVISAARKPRWQ